MNDHIEGASLSAYLDGALTSAQRADCQSHLSSCAACREEFKSLRHLKLVVAAAPRKTMPADLVLALERRLVGGLSWWTSSANPRFWIPAGATAAAAFAVAFWLQGLRAADEIPLEPLLAAHARYSAEGLVAQENLVASTYSDQLSAMYTDSTDAELQ